MGISMGISMGIRWLGFHVIYSSCMESMRWVLRSCTLHEAVTSSGDEQAAAQAGNAQDHEQGLGISLLAEVNKSKGPDPLQQQASLETWQTQILIESVKGKVRPHSCWLGLHLPLINYGREALYSGFRILSEWHQTMTVDSRYCSGYMQPIKYGTTHKTYIDVVVQQLGSKQRVLGNINVILWQC